MPTSFAVIVGVEKFVDPNIGAVGHAESDAKAVAAALEGIGWTKENQTVLLSADASQANVRYSLKQQLAAATKDDTLFFFFSGHGAALGTESHLIVRDSRLGDLKDTSLSLHDIFRWIDESNLKVVSSNLTPAPNLKRLPLLGRCFCLATYGCETKSRYVDYNNTWLMGIDLEG